MTRNKDTINRLINSLRLIGGNLVFNKSGKKTGRRFLAALLFFFIINAAAVLISLYFFILPAIINQPLGILADTGLKSPRRLDGRLADKDAAALRPIAVMMENHSDSRPVAGLENASLVYESIVEGEITRFLAIFDGRISAERIGPVRSARPFFVTLAEEWGAVYFHAGGSPQALQKLKSSPIFNLNEISSDGIYFFRDREKIAPHNLFTSASLIKQAVLAKEIDTRADFLPWLFKNDEPTIEAELAPEIEINFSKVPDYQVKYRYDSPSNSYVRYQAGEIHKTEAGAILRAKNVVLQYVKARAIDSLGRLNVTLIGQGQAEIYQDGQAIIGFWKKENNRTRFYDSAGREIRFNRGNVWVELVFEK
ncbi:MAG: hypothetical protein A3J65_03970 [Candidatus Buchananbacteria bacterium RIFCSPHIGHO2_02_FULL_45_11b]|uniref:DUF3048 domain-containing protein n=3 Tax=Candidatus Buchananiibacteriota TaxID=1817903 RepID=A0A1G1Y2D4_9BACT|nr:MAG: hypothetical protein A2663_02285 [Candidatus Buchananbacteria bacterium RIFCSPHIGHO2_01_FULL_46_12]OGY52555.1 MAG: hypothetical protein A3J65_03970 [Candidatus Buchananbacteria bacterium RIFCSPHIGHO2_02_FULL_45_11b]OGY54238.1 MAG: hypothetical protein A3B15_00710 [Candidatus Buchananbacteria bacterium RIFCSPLOWO2_01_FULL_45_31]